MFTQFSHVGVIVHDLDEALSLWRDIFGLKVVERMEVEEEGVRSVFLSTGGSYREATCVELVQPIDPDDHSKPIARRLADSGPGVFHLAFRADESGSVQVGLASAGLAYLDLPAVGADPTRRIVIHPRSTNGVLIEVLSDENGGPV